MADVVFPPSPNWYLSNIMCVSPDGVIIYGSSSNDITILTPVANAENNQKFKLVIIHSAHKKRITCVGMSPSWSTIPNFVTGSEDGIVKLWNKVSASYSIAHNLHLESNEDVVGVTFINEKEVVSVGNTGNIVLWNLSQNTVKVDNKVLKSYKPLCVSLCPLKQNTIAIGTKQGVVLVLSITDKFMMLFKAHGHETEVTSLCWCPSSYCDPLEKIVAMKRHKVKTFRVRKFSNRKPDSIVKGGSNATDSGLYQQSSGEEADESDIFDVNKETGLDECLELSDSDLDKDKKSDLNKSNIESDKKDESLSDTLKDIKLTDESKDSRDLEKNESFVDDCKKLLNFMNSKKALKSSNVSFILDPDESTLNESQCNPADESDIFDIYEEPPIHEFGHSKYIPEQSEDENVTAKQLTLKNDFLDECKKLENLLKGKDEQSTDSISEKSNVEKEDEEEAEQSVANESIFDIYEEPPFYEFGHSKYIPGQSDIEEEGHPKAKLSPDFLGECNKLKQHITHSKSDDKSSENESVSVLSNEINKLQINNSDDSPTKVEESSETQVESRDGNYFFLASACKNGKVCIWRWGGNLVSSGNVSGSKEDKFKKLGLPWSILFWPTSKLLLVASRGSQMLRCNFNSIYPRSKGFGFSVVHEEHIRGLYCITSNKSSESDSSWRNRSVTPLIWSIGQDRLLIAYSIDDNKVTAKINTFAGYVSNISLSPIDQNRYAIAVGDGMVRVWDYSSTCTENSGLGQMKVFWQNVQGKVQACDWHPTKENMLAFGNAEGRVGLIDASNQSAAKILSSTFSLGVYGVCWGPNNTLLYAHGPGKLVMYDTTNINQDPIDINVTILSRKWDITSITWTEEYFTVGSKEGGVALLKPDIPHDSCVTFMYPHRKRITCLSWHPLGVSTEDGISPCASMLAVSANNPLIIILNLVTNGDGVHLEVIDQISYHAEKVNKVCWSPHHNGRLLSVSSDNLAQVYDVLNKCPLHTIIGHKMSVLCCLWSPTDSNLVMTAGEDFSLRLWDLNEYPYQDIKPINQRQKKKMKLASLELKSCKIATSLSGNNKQNKEGAAAIKAEHSNGVLAQILKPKQKSTIVSESAFNLYWKQVKKNFMSVEGCQRLLNHYVSKVVEKSEDAIVDYSGGYDYLRIYGTDSDVNDLLDIEQQKFEETSSWNEWTILGLLRGDVKTVLEKAKENKQLSPSLLCLAPYVSNRYWKEMMTSYVHTEERYAQNKSGLEIHQLPIYKSIVMFAFGNVEDACNYLTSEGLIVDALVAAKIRHAEQTATECFNKLLDTYKTQMNLIRLAECYLANGELMDAAVYLGKSNEEESLALAAEIAKLAGNKVMADNITEANSHNSTSTVPLMNSE